MRDRATAYNAMVMERFGGGRLSRAKSNAFLCGSGSQLAGSTWSLAGLLEEEAGAELDGSSEALSRRLVGL